MRIARSEPVAADTSVVESQISPFDRLPDEILVVIFNHLDVLGSLSVRRRPHLPELRRPAQRLECMSTLLQSELPCAPRLFRQSRGIGGNIPQQTQALDLQPYWHRLTDAILDSIEPRSGRCVSACGCSAMQVRRADAAQSGVVGRRKSLFSRRLR
jgi:hypothetical protein